LGDVVVVVGEFLQIRKSKEERKKRKKERRRRD
jgi:hypothetical protein